MPTEFSAWKSLNPKRAMQARFEAAAAEIDLVFKEREAQGDADEIQPNDDMRSAVSVQIGESVLSDAGGSEGDAEEFQNAVLDDAKLVFDGSAAKKDDMAKQLDGLFKKHLGGATKGNTKLQLVKARNSGAQRFQFQPRLLPKQGKVN